MAIVTTKRDVVWGYIGTVLSMGANFVLLPFLMVYLSEDYLGLWYVFVSIGALSTLFDFGFNPTIARNVAFVWTGVGKLQKKGLADVVGLNKRKVDFFTLAKLQKTCRLLYLVIALLALVVLGTAGTFYILYIAASLDLELVVVTWGVYLLALFLNLYYGYYATLLRGVGAVEKSNQTLVLSRCIQLVLSIALMLFGAGIIAPVLGYLAYGLIYRLFSRHAFFRYKGIGESLKAISEKPSFSDALSYFPILWYSAWREGLVAVSNYLANQASVVVASLFLSLGATGLYSISVQLVTAIVTIASVPYTSMQPAMQSAWVENRIRFLRKSMASCMVAYDILCLAGLVLLLVAGLPLLRIVKPDTVIDPLFLLLYGLYFLLFKRHQLYASFIANSNHLPYVAAYVASSFAGIVLCVVFCAIFSAGVWGLLLGQALSQLAYNGWRWPHEAMKMIQTNEKCMLIEGFVGLGGLFQREKK